MQIGDLARRGGVSIQTVRYYERCGLLPKPERKPSRYRIYGENDVYRLQFIRHAKTLGFTLDEIKHILVEIVNFLNTYDFIPNCTGAP